MSIYIIYNLGNFVEVLGRHSCFFGLNPLSPAFRYPGLALSMGPSSGILVPVYTIYQQGLILGNLDSVLGLVLMVWGMVLIFGYLDA